MWERHKLWTFSWMRFEALKANLYLIKNQEAKSPQDIGIHPEPESEEKGEEIVDVEAIVFSQCPDEKVEEWNLQDPPETEPQFFTLEPEVRTPDQILALIKEKLANL